LADASKAEAVLRKIIELRPDAGWKEEISKTKAKLRWFQPNIKDEELLPYMATKGTITNRYPDVKVLAHKDTFAALMNLCMRVNPKGYDMIPPSFNLSLAGDRKRFDTYQQDKKDCVYIAKPQVGAQGDNIALFRDLKDLPFTLENKEIIVQRYLDKPLLVDGLKFDLRVYVVAIGINPVQAFVCDEGLARFCTVSQNSLSYFTDRKNTKLLQNQTSRKLTCTSQITLSIR
jgi:hypothetical protein